MTQGGFFEPRPINAPGLIVVIAMHAAVLTAVALSKMEVIHIDRGPLKLLPIHIPPPPPENPVDPPKQRVQPRQTPQTPTSTDPIVKALPQGPVDFGKTPVLPDPGDLAGPITSPGPIVVPRDPVRTIASFDPHAEAQPPYPPSEQRRGGEEIVEVRVLIGLDGRVKAVEKVSATSDAFFRATERHALLRWRFKPATVDGKPVESWRRMTVRFELSAAA